MNGAETILAEILGAVIVLAVLGCIAAAREWVSVSVSVRTVPRAKRQGRTAAEAAPVPAGEQPVTPIGRAA